MGSKEDMLGLSKLLRGAQCHVPAKPWHALRHTFASHFMMSGGNILTLQKLLGHADLKMTMVYAHLSPDFVGAEVARMSFAAPRPAGVANLEEHRMLVTAK
jgi:site-specific recombinase XerD